MKQIIFLTIVFTNIHIINAQNLENTIWKGNILSTDMYFRIVNNIASFGETSNSLIASSVISTKNDTILWIDLPSVGMCATNDSGLYKYAITSNTLKFIVIKEPCSVRKATLTGTNWIGITTGVDIIDVSAAIKNFPNPFSSSTILQVGIELKNATLTLYDIYGRKVQTKENISGQKITLYRNNLPSGIYFYKLMQDNNLVATGKLIAE